jgi:hypothetical protein
MFQSIGVHTMTYTKQNAGLTLSSARHILANLDLGWTPDQIARARAVAVYWARIAKHKY